MAVKRKKTIAACSISAIIAIVISSHSKELHTSRDGLRLIGDFESCQAESYYCPAKVLTVGVGHTGSDIELNKTYSNEEIARLWVSDIKEAEACVIENVKAGVTQGQFDAYTSFAFNKGCGTFKRSSVLKYANSGDKINSCKSMLKYIYAGKTVLPGLVRRAKAESDLCLKN